MRAFAVAVALLLTVVVLPLEAPSAEAAARHPVPSFVYIYSTGTVTPPGILISSATPDGEAWNCNIATSPPGVVVDVTVSCTSQTLSNFEGRCRGIRVGAQSGSDPQASALVLDLIAPVMAPPAPVVNALAGETWMEIDGTCGPTAHANAGFYTPGANAASDVGTGTTFQCTLHIDDGAKAYPWNAFCLGAA